MNVSNTSFNQGTANHIKYESVVLACLPKKDENVFLNQSTVFQVVLNNLKADGSHLSEVEVKEKAELNECIVSNSLVVENLVANRCILGEIQGPIQQASATNRLKFKVVRRWSHTLWCF